MIKYLKAISLLSYVFIGFIGDDQPIPFGLILLYNVFDFNNAIELTLAAWAFILTFIVTFYKPKNVFTISLEIVSFFVLLFPILKYIEGFKLKYFYWELVVPLTIFLITYILYLIKCIMLINKK